MVEKRLEEGVKADELEGGNTAMILAVRGDFLPVVKVRLVVCCVISHDRPLRYSASTCFIASSFDSLCSYKHNFFLEPWFYQ
jgi:hypothetical protein